MEKPLLERFRQAYRDLELFPLLSAEQIEAFRVDYSSDTLAHLEGVVDNVGDKGKIIFAGHRGCGKSTLLAKFARQMMQQGYFVVRFSISDLVEMSDVNHVNILYSVALMLLSKATERQVAIPEKTKEALVNWLTTTQTQTEIKDLKSELGLGGDVLKLATVKLKNESTFREEIKRTYTPKVSELARKADEIASLIQSVTKKEVLVVIDDLDKLDLNLVEDIYRNNIGSLFLPNFRIIYTIPISAIRNNEVLAVLQSIGPRMQLMSVTKFYSKAESHRSDVRPREELVQLFLKVLEKRIAADLIEPEIAREIVLKSGGVIRELVRIARECCNECTFLIRTQPERQDIKINGGILTVALKNLRNEFARPLGSNLYSLLAETYQNFKPADAKSPEFLSLLHGLYVLEYENDDLWYDLHPIVIDLLKRENLIERHASH